MAPKPRVSKSSGGGRGRGRGKRKSVVVEAERTDNNMDSVSSVEKNVPPISESTKRQILDSTSQDEQDTHETRSVATCTFDSNDTQSDSGKT